MQLPVLHWYPINTHHSQKTASMAGKQVVRTLSPGQVKVILAELKTRIELSNYGGILYLFCS